MDVDGGGVKLMGKLWRLVLLSVISLLSTAGVSVANAKDSFALCVHPFLPATELLARFKPLADELGNLIDENIVVEISNDYSVHLGRIHAGSCEIAYIGPALYVRYVEKYGNLPLLARLEVKGKPTIQGMIFVREDSSIRTLGDLKGKAMAFGDPFSTLSSLVPKAMLRQAGISLESLSKHAHLRNHRNVALAVLSGEYAAGAVKMDVFNRYRHRGLRVLQPTPEISEHLFVSGKGLSPEQVERLRIGMLNLSKSSSGMKILSKIKSGVTALVQVDDDHYEALRDILIQPTVP